jgi:hypothetical protein
MIVGLNDGKPVGESHATDLFKFWYGRYTIKLLKELYFSSISSGSKRDIDVI